MRPDDEYVDVEETPAAGSRAMSWAVLAVAVGGFAALAYYAYHSGNKTPSESDAMVVEADATPIKEAPANPEGEQFPDKDKTIYDVIAPNGEAKQGEQLMPDPEHPIAAANVEDSEDESAGHASQPAATTATAAPAPVAGGTTTATNGATTFVANEAPTTVTEQPVASYSNPQMVNEKPAGVPKETPKATPKTETKPKETVKAEKPKTEAKAEKPAAKPAAGGAYKVQLGAYKSESEAQASWKKISGKYSNVLSGSPSITTVESNGATLYRLRAGSFANAAAAKEICGKLGSTPCMPVK